MVRVNWKGMFIVIPLVWYAIALTVRSPQLNQYIVQENVTYVPMNHEEYMKITKGIKCEDPNHILAYVLDSVSNRTHLGCFYEKIVVGSDCPEVNIDRSGRVILQPKFMAPCGNLDITPCDFAYNSSESYKLFGCFIVYGGIPSLMQQGQKIENLEQEELISKKLIENLKKSLKERDEEITSLKKSPKEKDEETTSLKKSLKERDETITNQYVAIWVVVTCIIIIATLAFLLFCIKYRMGENRKNTNYSGNQLGDGQRNEDDPLNGPFQNIRAADERRSNEDEPLNRPFENVSPADINDIAAETVELVVEYNVEDQPPISLH